jgi:transaldolase/glucose-6-phosphate isomerase
MVYACKNHNAKDNPGTLLGTILGTSHKNGRDKLTIITSPKIFDLGAWLEQLIAESTGKQGVSIVPIDGEKIEVPEKYGDDRLFVYLKLEGDSKYDAAIDQIERAGQPVIKVVLTDTANLGQEFFRWEIATAVAGSIMGINTFNQPDVEFSKVETRKLTDEYEKTGHLPDENPFYEGDGIKLFSDEKNRDALNKIVGEEKTLANYLKAHLSRVKTDDYFALLAYLEMNAGNQTRLQDIRGIVQEKNRVATCLGFGPRFLHSTGQAYKGGANNGVFLQLTSDDATDLEVPNQKFTFGTVKAAQARGDFQVLVDRERRALRVHLGSNVVEGLHDVLAAIS